MTTIPSIPTPAPTLYLLHQVRPADHARGTSASALGVVAMTTFDEAEAAAWRASVAEFAPEVANLDLGHWNACVTLAKDPHDPCTHPREVARFRRAWTAVHDPTRGDHRAFTVLDEVFAHDGTCMSLAMAGAHEADRLLIEARELASSWLEGLAEPDTSAATRLRDRFMGLLRRDRPLAIARSRHLDYVETRA